MCAVGRVAVTLLLLWGASVWAGRGDRRHSYLRDFIAARRDIFPLSTDIQRRQVSPASDSTGATLNNNNMNNYNNHPSSVRQIRHSVFNNINQETLSPREVIIENNQKQFALYTSPKHSPVNSRRNNRVLERGRKLNAQSTDALLLQYATSNHVNEYKPVKVEPVQDSQYLDHRNISSEHLHHPKQDQSIITSSSNNVTPIYRIQNEQLINTEQILQLLRRTQQNFSGGIEATRGAPPQRQSVTARPNRLASTSSLFDTLMASLRRIPIIGNVLRATVDPVYRPILNSILPMAENRQSMDASDEAAHCFGSLGCLVTTNDFYDPIIRPINLPPDTREAINTHYTLYTRMQQEGVHVAPQRVNKIRDTTYNPANPTKFIIHGFLDDQNSTWIKDMTRGLLKHGDYNVLTVDWSSGSRVMYHQAVSNIRVVALEVAALINWMHTQLGQKTEDVHVIGHSLGSHTAGHVGERVPGLGRITGLDPAEPFFQYMPSTVRLDPTDAAFVDVIHTDTDSIITQAWQLAGYGLEQPVGHVDFYPNGGRQQPGCSSLSRIPLIALQDGAGIAEGLDAAEKEAVACNHVRANKLFTASLQGSCSFQAFPCKSYKEFDKAKCFSCDTALGCAPLGIHADSWRPRGNTNVKMYLSTSQGPHFCQYHYRLTITLGDESGQGGSLRGRVIVTLITQEGELKEFDLTQSSPLVFRRGSTRTFLLRHGDDLSLTRDALLHWQFEADVFNLMTFCVLFCTADLEVAAVTLTPLDTPDVAHQLSRNLDSNTPPDIVMCHKQGNAIVKIKSESTIKVSAEPFCPAVRRLAEGGGGIAVQDTAPDELSGV